MINIFSTIIGIILFSELLFVIALLKPVKEPYYIRDLWYHLQDNASIPSKIVGVVVFSLFVNTFMDMSWEKSHHGNLLAEVKDANLVLEFYLCKMSMSYTCFFIVLFLFMLIERIVQTIIIIARLLEFELMCRHAILTRENATQVYRTVIVLKNLFDALKNNNMRPENIRVYGSETGVFVETPK